MKEINIDNVLAIGNGENCPFCINTPDNEVFIMQENKDFIKHCVENHPTELNRALFSSKPKPKYWLEKEFVGLIAHIAAKLKFIEKPDRITDEDYSSVMEEIYHLVSNYYNEVMTHESD